MKMANKYKSPTFFYPKQQEIFDCKAREVFVIASNKVGKTLALGLWLNEKALLGKPGGKYCWLAPYAKTATIGFDLVKKIILQSSLYNSLDKMKHKNRFRFNASSPQKITYPNGNVIEFIQGENPTAIFGEQYRHAVIDEATRLKQTMVETADGGMQIYCPAYAALRTTMRVSKGQIKGISNPTTANNYFYKMYLKAKEDSDTNTAAFHLSSLDAVKAGFLSQAEFDYAKDTEIPYIFKRDWLGLVPEIETSVFSAEKIQECINNDIKEDLSKALYLGVDLGYTVNNKSDWTVIVGLDRDCQVVFFRKFKAEGPDLINKLKPYIGNKACFIDATAGGGHTVFTTLQTDCPNLEPVKFNNQNKCDCIETLAHYINTGKISFKNNDTIVSELLGYEVELDDKGKAFYNNGKSVSHDDSVIAMGLAVLKYKELGNELALDFFL